MIQQTTDRWPSRPLAPAPSARRLHGPRRSSRRAPSPTPTSSTIQARTAPSSRSVYAGLAVSGQQGAAGTPGHLRASTKASRSTCACYWEAQELPTDEAVIGWGDVGLPEMNTQIWAVTNTLRRRDVLPHLLPGRHGERVPAPDDRREARRARQRQRRAPRRRSRSIAPKRGSSAR